MGAFEDEAALVLMSLTLFTAVARLFCSGNQAVT